MESKSVGIRTFYKFFSILGILSVLAVGFFIYRKGALTSIDVLRDMVWKAGHWGPLIFIAVQMIQVVIPVLPGGISCAAGVVIFGSLWGFIYNYVGVLIGSIIAFLIARQLGRPFLKRVASGKTYHKYIQWLEESRRFDKLFAIAIFIPVAPDDFLCMLAGVTEMTLRKFVLILVLCKPCSILLYSVGFTTIVSWLG